jgi:hypothetical protein
MMIPKQMIDFPSPMGLSPIRIQEGNSFEQQ